MSSATAWALGLAITPFHLWRVTWFAPFGLGAAWFLVRLRAWIPARYPGRGWIAVGVALALQITALAAASQVVSGRPWSEADLPGHSERAYWTRSPKLACVPTFSDLRGVGDLLEAAGGRPLVVGEESVNDFVPAVSARAELLVFRVPEFMAELHVADSAARWQRYRTAVSATATPPERLRALRESGATHLVTCASADVFAGLAQAAPDTVTPAVRIGELVVYEIVAPAGRRLDGAGM